MLPYYSKYEENQCIPHSTQYKNSPGNSLILFYGQIIRSTYHPLGTSL